MGVVTEDVVGVITILTKFVVEEVVAVEVVAQDLVALLDADLHHVDTVVGVAATNRASIPSTTTIIPWKTITSNP